MHLDQQKNNYLFFNTYMTEYNDAVERPADRVLTILVVEDNEVNQLLASIVLRSLGHEVIIANDGRECLNLLAVHNYDCILMDIYMPELDGLETTRYIRQVLKSKVPIIGVSADMFPEDIHQSLEAGMNEQIEKLYTEQRMREVLARWVK